MNNNYIPRFADEELQNALGRMGAVLIEGVKNCGKTETARHHAASSIHLDLDSAELEIVKLNSRIALDGELPRLIDEWQNAPAVWDAVRREVDNTRALGSFILTGSTAPSENLARHSGAGRFARLKMHTLSFAESGHSTEQVSLDALLSGEDFFAQQSGHEIQDVFQRIAHGGWPAYRNMSLKNAQENLKDYAATVANVDIRTPDGVVRDSAKVRQLLLALSRAIGTETSISTLAKDTGLSRDVTREYLDALTRIFVHVEQPAWAAHLRSTATLRKAPKRHLADPALALAILGATPQRVLKDLNFAGQLFESQVFHDLSVYGGRRVEISHARDSFGREVDMVIKRSDGRWALVEVKLGSLPDVIDPAIASLKRFAEQIELRTYEHEPELIIITGSGYSYRHPEGVSVVSLTTLTK